MVVVIGKIPTRIRNIKRTPFAISCICPWSQSSLVPQALGLPPNVGRRAWYPPTSTYCSILRNNLITYSNTYQGKGLCFRWPANCSNHFFEFASCIHWHIKPKKTTLLNSYGNILYTVYTEIFMSTTLISSMA